MDTIYTANFFPVSSIPLTSLVGHRIRGLSPGPRRSTRFPVRRPLRVAFVLLAVATIFRLWTIQHARFTGDESDYWVKSRRVAIGRYAPVFGPEITGSEANLPGPAYYYLMAAPQALGASPYFGSIFVVLGHALAAWLLFLLARRAAGDRAGLIALALVMFAPWDVLYADRIWGSCVVPIWGALSLYAAVQSRSSGRWQAVLLFLCLVLPQLHLSVPILWLACAMILVLRPPEKLAWRWIALGIGLAFLAYLGPLISELRNDFVNTRTILSKGTGGESWDVAKKVPFQVFGYAIGYASSEIGYHFAKGYWGGNFDDVAAYFTRAGWQRYFTQHGLVLGALGVTSLLLALAAWLDTIVHTGKRTLAAVKARRRDALDLGDVLTIAILAGLFGGAMLMMLAKKRYFPHYANILVPIALWPAVAALDRWWSKRRVVVGALLAITATSMFFACVRYYRNVDTLNGLGNTIDMVGYVLEDDAPVRIDFTYFHNIYAWSVIADALYGERLPNHAGAPIRYRVHNRERFEGDPGAGQKVFGGVLLERTPPRGDKTAIGSDAFRRPNDFEVRAIAADGTERRCVRRGEKCFYGDHPWQHFAPDFLTIGARLEPVLFLHPIKDATVEASLPIPPEQRRGVLKVALSDDATRSDNREPVLVTLSRGDELLGRTRAENRPGFVRLPFTLTATGAPDLTVGITTAHDGARIFAFDIVFE